MIHTLVFSSGCMATSFHVGCGFKRQHNQKCAKTQSSSKLWKSIHYLYLAAIGSNSVGMRTCLQTCEGGQSLGKTLISCGSVFTLMNTRKWQICLLLNQAATHRTMGVCPLWQIQTRNSSNCKCFMSFPTNELIFTGNNIPQNEQQQHLVNIPQNVGPNEMYIILLPLLSMLLLLLDILLQPTFKPCVNQY